MPTIVSIQRISDPNPVTGHVAWAAPLGPDAVVVPSPGEWLDGDDRWEVLVADRDPSRPVQRFSPAAAYTIGLESDPEGAVVIVRLNGGSASLTPTACFDPAVLDANLAGGGPVWSALEASKVVPPGVTDQDVDKVLGPVAKREARQRVNLRRTALLAQFPPAWINPFCLISPRCGCTPP